MTRTQEGWWKLGMSPKPVWNWHTVTSTHSPLAGLSHEAKHKVSGMGKVTPTYREAWQEQGGKKE